MRSSFTHMHVTMSPTYRRVTYLPTYLYLHGLCRLVGGRVGSVPVPVVLLSLCACERESERVLFLGS